MSPLLKQAFVLAIATSAFAAPNNQHRQHKHLHRDTPGKYGYNPSTTCTETASTGGGYPIANATQPYGTASVVHTKHHTKPHFTYGPVISSTAVAAPVSESAQGSTPASPAAASESPQGYAPVSPAAASNESSNEASPVTAPNVAGSAPAPVAVSSAANSCPAIPDVTITTTTKVYVTVTETANAGSESASESSSTPAATSNVAPSPASHASAPSSTSQQTVSAYSSSSSAQAAPVDTSTAPPPAYSVTTSSASPEAASTTSVAAASYSSSQFSSAVASAAQSHPSSYPSGLSSSGKRGLAYNDASLLTCFASSPQVNWAYNWASSEGGSLPSNVQYIPTLWGAQSVSTNSWNTNAQTAISNGAKYLFSFNEPDNAGQSALSPQEAATAYKQWMQPFAGKGVKLVAPSVTNGAAPMGLAWLTDFLSACDGCQVDAVNVHWYSPVDATQNFKDHVSNATQLSGGKPVFVSEFAPTDGSPSDISGFLQDVMPWMDGQDSVLGYAYFMASNGVLISGTEPSSYGQVYASYTGSSASS